MDRVYNKKSLVNAKKLRIEQTEFEEIIWQHLRAKRLNGIKFRRQVPVGIYILDFVALSKKLVVEIDGSQHIELQQAYDNVRTEYLKQNGYTVLRFYNNDITNNIYSVLNKIVDTYNNL